MSEFLLERLDELGVALVLALAMACAAGAGAAAERSTDPRCDDVIHGTQMRGNTTSGLATRSPQSPSKA